MGALRVALVAEGYVRVSRGLGIPTNCAPLLIFNIDPRDQTRRLHQPASGRVVFFNTPMVSPLTQSASRKLLREMQ